MIALSVAYAIYVSNDWPVPASAKLVRNPVAPSPAVFAAARSIYQDKCANCHGDTGKGDGPDASMYYPSPASLADANRMSNRTDGELYYRITHGRRPMPAFQNRLSNEQRWQLVLYIRTFAERPAPSASK